MLQAKRKTWLMGLVAVLLSVGVLCAYLMVSGHRFAVQAVFTKIHSIAPENQANDNALIAEFNRQLAGVTDPERQSDFQQAIQETKDGRLGFICIDDSTLSLFSTEQRAVLEESLARYYAKVFWGQSNIPSGLKREDGGLRNGIVFGCSIKVYPGLVKLNYHSWSGFMSAGGQTEVFVWKGAGLHPHGRIGVWIS
jgi:hypothetical protein